MGYSVWDGYFLLCKAFTHSFWRHWSVLVRFHLSRIVVFWSTVKNGSFAILRARSNVMGLFTALTRRTLKMQKPFTLWLSSIVQCSSVYCSVCLLRTPQNPFCAGKSEHPIVFASVTFFQRSVLIKGRAGRRPRKHHSEKLEAFASLLNVQKRQIAGAQWLWLVRNHTPKNTENMVCDKLSLSLLVCLAIFMGYFISPSRCVAWSQET